MHIGRSLLLCAALAPLGAAADARPVGEPASSGFVLHALEWTATAIEIGGVAIIVLGVLLATGRFLYRGMGAVGFGAAYHALRAELGRGILLGLEFLVAADIIGTVAITPTFTSVGVLAGIVLIRTFLSVSLAV